jgi:hypothetical protein
MTGMRLDEIVPDRWIWTLGTVVLLMAGSLFLYDALHPNVRVYARTEPRASWAVEKASAFAEPSESTAATLAKLPELAEKYKHKVFYVPKRRERSAWGNSSAVRPPETRPVNRTGKYT